VLIVGEVREGRFTGTKREAGFPQNAGIFCQREAWPPHHRDYIGFGDKPLMKFSVRRVRHIP